MSVLRQAPLYLLAALPAIVRSQLFPTGPSREVRSRSESPPTVVNCTSLTGLFVVNTAGLPTIFTVLGELALELKRHEEILPVHIAERIEQTRAPSHSMLTSRPSTLTGKFCACAVVALKLAMVTVESPGFNAWKVSLNRGPEPVTGLLFFSTRTPSVGR